MLAMFGWSPYVSDRSMIWINNWQHDHLIEFEPGNIYSEDVEPECQAVCKRPSRMLNDGGWSDCRRVPSKLEGWINESIAPNSDQILTNNCNPKMPWDRL